MLGGKVAVVTGASSGIGRALAVGFADAGASVVLAARTRDLLKATTIEIEQNGGSATAVVTDVTNRESVASLYDEVGQTHGLIDLLVINAGGNFAKATIEAGEPDSWLYTLQVNLVGAYLTLKYAIPLLRKAHNARVICIGSGMGHNAPAGSSAYACAKAGLWMLVRQAAQELREDGISVNELIPGPVDTGNSRSVARRSDNLFETEWIKTPEDVVPLALFLATHPGIGPTAQSFSIMRRPR